jgi:hypothetical protein
MAFLMAIFVYLLMAAILIAGIIMAVQGSFWLLIFGVVGFSLLITKISILHH